MAFKVVDENNIKDFKNFTLEEIKCKCKGKYCNGYPVGFSYELMEQLQKIRNYFGKPIMITSAVRCTKHNANVGGVKNSKHTQGKAVDFYVKGISYATLKKYIDTLPNNNYSYNITGSVMHHDIKPTEIEEKYNLTRILKKGCVGEDVKKLQKQVGTTADGVFGNNTYNKVKTFQKNNKLYADGIVGKNTAHKLGWLFKGK